jgi:hypothetical protein
MRAINRYVCVYVCMYACMHACTYVVITLHTYLIYTCTYMHTLTCVLTTCVWSAEGRTSRPHAWGMHHGSSNSIHTYLYPAYIHTHICTSYIHTHICTYVHFLILCAWSAEGRASRPRARGMHHGSSNSRST